MAKQYELTYTASKNLAPEESNSLFERVSSILPQTTTSEKGHDFFYFEFYAEPEAIEDIKKKLRSESQIKKYLLMKKGAFKPAKIRRMPPHKTIELEQEKQREQKVEKVELKEIDEKLKQIFGE